MNSARTRAIVIIAAMLSSRGATLAQQPEAAPSGPSWKEIFQVVQSGRCAEAVPMLDGYVRDNPEAARAFYFLGYCHGVLGADGDALAALARAQEIRPDMAGVSVMRGKILTRVGKRDEAAQAFRDEIEKAASPELTVEAWAALADLHTQAQQDADALAAWEKVIELAPARQEPYAAASALELKAGRLDEANAILDRGATAGASNPTARLNVGIAYFNKKELAKAAAVFNGVASDPSASPADVASAWGLLGKVHLREGRNPDAAAAIKKSLAADPSSPMAKELGEMLKGLEKPAARK